MHLQPDKEVSQRFGQKKEHRKICASTKECTPRKYLMHPRIVIEIR